MLEPIELSNGKQLRIKYCTMYNFMELKNIVFSNLKIKLDSNFIDKFANLTIKDFLTQFLEPIIALIGKKELDEVLLKCADGCVIESGKEQYVTTDKVTLDYFEQVENRQIYFEVLTNILIENIKAFFPKGAGSK
jgi:hypothetical protein